MAASHSQDALRLLVSSSKTIWKSLTAAHSAPRFFYPSQSRGCRPRLFHFSQVGVGRQGMQQDGFQRVWDVVHSYE